MFRFGTLINVVAIVVGGIGGKLFGRLLGERHQESLIKTIGVCVLFISIAGAMSGMLQLDGGSLTSAHSLLIIASLAPGMLIGEFLDIEGCFEAFGEWLKRKTGNAKDKNFVDGFVNASLAVCIGAMAIVGSIQDGLYGDWSLLATKSVLDFVIIMVMTCTLGEGCAFSAIPVAVLQSLITTLAHLFQPLMTETALAYLSLVGSIMIFCVGLNLVWGKKIRVANLLPALVLAVAIAFLPINI